MPKSEGFEEMKSESISSFLQLSLDATASSSPNVRDLETISPPSFGNREPQVLSCQAAPRQPKGPNTQCGANIFK